MPLILKSGLLGVLIATLMRIVMPQASAGLH